MHFQNFIPPQLQVTHWRLTMLLCLMLLAVPGYGQQQFSSLEDLLAFADANSAVAKSASAQNELASLQSLAAKANTVNLRGNLSFNATNNFALPVNFIPAEVFGGPSGTFRQITFGQQYVSVASISPQLDLVNPASWARIKSANLSQELTGTTNLLNTRNLHEAIASAYFTFCSFASQLEFARQTAANADSIAAIASRRVSEGISRRSEYNNAEANRINLVDFVRQLQSRMEQQRLNLASLIGIPNGENLELKIGSELGKIPESSPESANSKLQTKQAMLQAELQKSELAAQRLNFMPTVSLTAGFNWQQNSNEKLFDSNDWIDSRYIGLKITVPIPTETRLWSSSEEYRISHEMKTISAGQTAILEANQNQQLLLDFDRSRQAFETAKAISDLRTENYDSYTASYKEGLIGADLLLTAFTDYLNAQLTFETAKWNHLFQIARMEINHRLQ